MRDGLDGGNGVFVGYYIGVNPEPKLLFVLTLMMWDGRFQQGQRGQNRHFSALYFRASLRSMSN